MFCLIGFALWGMMAPARPIAYLDDGEFHAIRGQVEQSLSTFHLDEAATRVRGLNQKAYEAFYLLNIDVYKYLSTQHSRYRDQLMARWDEGLDQIELLPETDSLKEVMVADLYCKRSIIAFLDESYFQAVRYARSGRKMILKSANKWGDFPDQMKLRGLFNVLLGAIPSKYQWITQTLGYEGDVQLGMEQLTEASTRSKLLRMEASLVSCFVEKNMLNRTQQALERLVKARQQGPNILLDFILASGYMSIKQNQQALDILNRREQYQQGGVFFIPYWDYLLGKAYYYQGHHRNAQIYFSRFLKGYKGKLFRSDAYFRLAMSLTLDGSYAQGKGIFTLISSDEFEGLDEDAYARAMAEKFAQNPPNAFQLNLFQARNLFDGGYLSQAVEILDEVRAKKAKLSQDEICEMHYRYGRVYHSQGKLTMARENYQASQAFGTEEVTWMKASAAYYQGEIARQLGQWSIAEKEYKRALAYDDYFYQAGIENRCKAALGELKHQRKNQASSSKR